MPKIPINSDRNEYLFRPQDDLDLLEEAVKTPEGVRRVAINLESALILGARGIADHEVIIESIKSYAGRMKKYSFSEEEEKIAEVILEEIEKDNGVKLFSNIGETLDQGISEGHQKAEQFVEKAAVLFKTPKEELVHNLHERLSFLSKGELKRINMDDECGGTIANTMKRDELGKAAALIHLKISLDEKNQLDFQAITPNNSYEHELIHMFAENDSNNSVSSSYGSDDKLRTMQWRGFRPYLYYIGGRYDADLSYDYRRGPKKAYDYQQLNEGATSLIRALMYTDGDIYSAREMLSRNSFGTFEPISYTKWALKIAEVVEGIGVQDFLETYRQSDIERFNDLITTSTGRSVENLLKDLAN